jgi:hypothetical protein
LTIDDRFLFEHQLPFKRPQSFRDALKNRAFAYTGLLLMVFPIVLGFFSIRFHNDHKFQLSEPPLGFPQLSGFEYTALGELLTCGEKFEDAVMAGCIFDIMTFAWTPPACLDTEVHDDVTSELSELAPTRMYISEAD